MADRRYDYPDPSLLEAHTPTKDDHAVAAVNAGRMDVLQSFGKEDLELLEAYADHLQPAKAQGGLALRQTLTLERMETLLAMQTQALCDLAESQRVIAESLLAARE